MNVIYLSWSSRWLFAMNSLLQCLHLWTFPVICLFSCPLKLIFFANFFPQCLHDNFLTSFSFSMSCWPHAFTEKPTQNYEFIQWDCFDEIKIKKQMCTYDRFDWSNNLENFESWNWVFVKKWGEQLTVLVLTGAADDFSKPDMKWFPNELNSSKSTCEISSMASILSIDGIGVFQIS